MDEAMAKAVDIGENDVSFSSRLYKISFTLVTEQYHLV